MSKAPVTSVPVTFLTGLKMPVITTSISVLVSVCSAYPEILRIRRDVVQIRVPFSWGEEQVGENAVKCASYSSGKRI
jgi:hypothetical protein